MKLYSKSNVNSPSTILFMYGYDASILYEYEQLYSVNKTHIHVYARVHNLHMYQEQYYVGDTIITDSTIERLLSMTFKVDQ